MEKFLIRPWVYLGLLGPGLLTGCIGMKRPGGILASDPTIKNPPAAVGFQPTPVPGNENSIPADPLPVSPARVASSEIPLVPVPPVPLAGDRKGMGTSLANPGSNNSSNQVNPGNGSTKNPSAAQGFNPGNNANPVNPAGNTTTIPTNVGPGNTSGSTGVVPVSATQIQPGGAAVTPMSDQPPVMQPSEPVTIGWIQHQAQKTMSTVDCYMARLTRREPGKGKKEEEILLFQARKNPFSVHFKWLAGEGKGREVLYVKDRFENKLHTMLAPGDIPLTPGGRVISLPLDSLMVRSQSKYPITHAGIGPMVERFSAVVEANAQNDFRKGRMTYLGQRQRPDYDVPLYLVELAYPPGADLDVPNGGKRLIGYHPKLMIPVMTILYDERDRELEYNRFDRILLNIRLDDSDFDPGNMGKPSKSDQ